MIETKARDKKEVLSARIDVPRLSKDYCKQVQRTIAEIPYLKQRFAIKNIPKYVTCLSEH